MPLNDFSSLEWVLMVGAFSAAGLVRGFNGGAGANFLTAPVLAAIVGPREAVPIVLLANFLSNFQLLPGALPHVNRREMLPITLAVAVGIPFGAWALFTLDEDLMRRAVAATAVFFSLLMLMGWRYRGPRGRLLSVGAGGSAGVLAGAVSMGGPPVFLYLMSGSDGAAVNRANFLTYGIVAQLVAIVVFGGMGAITERMLWLTMFLLVPFLVCVFLGERLFRRSSEEFFRRASLGCMMLVSLVILVI